MSQQSLYSIRCPKCENVQEVPLYDSINVQESPEMREILFKNEINEVTCEQCESVFRIDKPLLYNDPERRLLVYWIPTEEHAVEEGQQQFRSSVNQLSEFLPDEIDIPEVHLVFTRTELIERIFMFEADLDERIIEYIKYTIYSNNMKKIDPVNKTILFNAHDSTPEVLCFVVQDHETKNFEAVLQYDREAYDALCEMFDRDEETANLLELFPGPYINARTLILSDADTTAE